MGTARQAEPTAETAAGVESVTLAGAIAEMEPGVGVTANRIIQKFDPDQIRIDPVIHALRRWTGHSKQEEAIELLLNQIRADGQRSAGLVRINEQGEFVLVFGERRLEAVKRLRLEPGWGETLYEAEVDPELNEVQALHIALGENGGGRADFTPMEKAGHIEVVKQVLGLKGMTRKDKEAIAEFFGWRSAAHVDNHLLLLELPQNVQEQVANEELTFSAAVEIARGNREKAGPVAKVARKLAEKEAGDKAKKNSAKQSALPAGAAQDASEEKSASSHVEEKTEAGTAGKATANGTLATDAVIKPPVVTAKHVRQAQKQVKGSVDKQRAPKMSEFCDLVETWDGPALGDSKSPARRFIQTLAEYGRGKLRGDADKKLLSAYEDVVFQKAVSKPAKAPAKKAVKAVTKPTSKVKAPAKASAKTAVKKAATKAAPKAAKSKKR
jgi:ParB/RepB/Spo0J family partition protein